MQTTAGGNSQETCTSNPFGDGLTCTGGADATEQHFTGKDHDAESGLDYFYARYYSETLGRFMTPDWAAAPAAVPYAAYGDPQSLNLYAYVQNNPLTGIDATGHYGSAGDVSDGNPEDSTAEQESTTQSEADAQASSAGSSGNGNSNGTPGTNKTPGTNPPPSAPGDSKSPSNNNGEPAGQTGQGQGTGGGNQQAQNGGCPAGTVPKKQKMLVTGYDNSKQSTGKSPGDKGYGVTKSGTKAGPGTVAAPTKYPMGTKMIVPGYGTGTVEDRGGAIKGAHIDVWFSTTTQAMDWGAQHLTVTVCEPR
jgi:RHS repeat-associated protein